MLWAHMDHKLGGWSPSVTGNLSHGHTCGFSTFNTNLSWTRALLAKTILKKKTGWLNTYGWLNKLFSNPLLSAIISNFLFKINSKNNVKAAVCKVVCRTEQLPPYLIQSVNVTYNYRIPFADIKWTQKSHFFSKFYSKSKLQLYQKHLVVHYTRAIRPSKNIAQKQKGEKPPYCRLSQAKRPF